MESRSAPGRPSTSCRRWTSGTAWGAERPTAAKSRFGGKRNAARSPSRALSGSCSAMVDALQIASRPQHLGPGIEALKRPARELLAETDLDFRASRAASAHVTIGAGVAAVRRTRPGRCRRCCISGERASAYNTSLENDRYRRDDGGLRSGYRNDIVVCCELIAPGGRRRCLPRGLR
jgi:hypothetical protein